MKFLRFCALAGVILSGLLSARGQTAFTYQGRLSDGTNAANGSYDLKFNLFNSPSGDTQSGEALTNSVVAVSNGRFTVKLDFGQNVFDGSDRWLQVGVRPGGSNSLDFVTLNPRMAVTPTPYALYAQTAGSVDASTIAATDSTTLAGNIQFAGNSAAPGYVWTATDASGNGRWVAVPTTNGASFSPTNVIFYVTNSTPQSPGWRIIPTNTLGVWSNNAVKWYAMSAPISNIALGHWGEYRAVSGMAPNPYDDPMGDLTYTFGFNFGGDETGFSAYGPTATNMPSWSKAVENGWQNYAGVTQLEDWWAWGSPYTQWGTNALWRWFGADLYWDTNDKTYAGSDVGFFVDNFHIGGAFRRTAAPGNYGFQVNDSGNGAKAVKLYGILTTYTNIANAGGVNLQGGVLSVGDPAGDNTVILYYKTDNGALNIASSDNFNRYVRSVLPFVWDFGGQNGTNVPLTVKAPAAGQVGDVFRYSDAYETTTYARIDRYGNGRFANFRAGVTNIEDGATSVVVTFSPAFSTTNYSVTVTPEFDYYPGYFFISDKTTNGFQFNLPAHASSGNVSWQAMLPQ